MGKRGRPSKVKPTLLLKSLPEVQTGATGAFGIKKLDLPLLTTSRAVNKKQKTPAIIRSSPRIRMHNTVGNQELEPVIHEIHVSENQKGLEPPRHEENKESRADETERCSKKDNPSRSDANYKTMYMGSQNKIEALLEENRKLMKALEFANGKVHVYEKQGNIYSEVMAVITSLSRVNKNLSAQLHLGVSDDEQ